MAAKGALLDAIPADGLTPFRSPANSTANRVIAGGAALLANSVLADSAIEHYRGSFRNPAMVLPLASAAVSLAVNGGSAATGYTRRPIARVSRVSHAASVLVGLTGLGFHLFNIGKRPGGFTVGNLFYKAPFGAPGALVLAGLLGAASGRGRSRRRSLGLLSPRATGAIIAGGLAGTVSEVGLLHFRGAFHNPAMWLPLSIPPLAAISLARDVERAVPSSVSVYLLAATAGLGIAGSAFHAYGVSRNMGGWSNWRQNLLAGPPIPAPPSFTGLAIAGIGVLMLLNRRRRD